MKVYDSTLERVIDSGKYAFLEGVEKLKKKNNLWGVVRLCLEYWANEKKEQYDSYIVRLKNIRETRRNKFSSTRDKSLRYTLDFPQQVMFLLRKIYSVEELPMDEKFMHQCWRRFPQLRVSEKY